MIRIELSKLRRGDFFRLSDNYGSPLWVRGYYVHNERKYEVYKYDNVCHEGFMRGTRMVFIEA